LAWAGWIDIDVPEAGVDWRKQIDEVILASQASLVRVAYAYEYALNTLKYACTVLAQAMES
jgi:hypothetical protein